VLQGAGLVRVRREATRHVYSVELRGIVELRRYLDALWDEALTSFKTEASKGKRTRER
jgi:DNA-binding transcriptional ArsR family regulator